MTSITLTNVISLTRWLRLKEILVIGLVGGIPPIPGRFLRNVLYRSLLVRMGKSVRIERFSEFLGSHQIELGDRVHIGQSCFLDASRDGNKISLGDHVWLHDNVRLTGDGINARILLREKVMLERGSDIKAHDNGLVEIGRRTYVGPYCCFAGPGPIKIGEDCMIASHAGIYANNHNFADLTLPMKSQGVTCYGITIEDDCWLGTGVKILDGVRIGRGSIIGAGAVVTKDIPPYSIAVGVPARVMAQRDGNKN
ncbi:acyltransferase [Scytonema sp. UIC 10036]|uniref:DapH/DapD/GlmU-related protein n=1 Tax=Scytonema sp. UIC 10036 TaxID=2304196 RepID=UPI0012DAA2E2|nr:DapH/DapD/GlmU-related protein [Scytonema sp. UIC 10036]MUG92446.1 acyltransferase [Scytonema sp. UIC 10036]